MRKGTVDAKVVMTRTDREGGLSKYTMVNVSYKQIGLVQVVW